MSNQYSYHSKCKVWSIRDPSTFQQRQLLSSNTRDITSAKKLVGVITSYTDMMIWDTGDDEEIMTDQITSYLQSQRLKIYCLSINANKSYLVLLVSKSIKNDVESAALVYNFSQELIFSTRLPFFADTRLYRPLTDNMVYVICSRIRTITKIDLENFGMEDVGGFPTNGDPLIGIPFRDSIFLLEGSYLTRLTVTSLVPTSASHVSSFTDPDADSDFDSKWSYNGILFSMDQNSRMLDLQGDGHYICTRMETGVLAYSFNLYDYEEGKGIKKFNGFQV